MKRLEKLICKRLKHAKEIKDSKIVFISDMHLGILDNSDETVRTKHLIFNALKYYLDNDYHVVCVGDTFELAENKHIEDIKNAHDNIMWIFSELYNKNKLTIIKGNHEEFLYARELFKRTHQYDGSTVDFLPNIKLENCVIADTDIIAVHGHEYFFQFSSWLNKVIVSFGVFWKKFQLICSDFTTCESTGWEKASKMDKAFSDLGEKLNKHFIVGHSHKCNFKLPHYTNCGSVGVMPRCITAVEVENNKVSTIKFSEEIDKDNFVKFTRTVIGEQIENA